MEWRNAFWFDKQEGHCLRISIQVVKWPERGDGKEGHRYCGLDGGRAGELGLTKTDSWEFASVHFAVDVTYRNRPKYLLVVKCFVLQDFLLKDPHVELARLRGIWIVLNINAKKQHTLHLFTPTGPCFSALDPEIQLILTFDLTGRGGNLTWVSLYNY